MPKPQLKSGVWTSSDRPHRFHILLPIPTTRPVKGKSQWLLFVNISEERPLSIVTLRFEPSLSHFYSATTYNQGLQRLFYLHR